MKYRQTHHGLILGMLIFGFARLAAAQGQGAVTGSEYVSPETMRQAVLNVIRLNYFDSIPLDSSLSIERAMSRLDPFSTYVTKEQFEKDEAQFNERRWAFGFGFAIVRHKVVITTIDYGSDLARAGVLPGDEILEIDGKQMRDSLPSLAMALSADMTFLRPATNDTFAAVIKKAILPEPSVGPYGMLDASTAYIRITGFEHGTAARLQAVLDSMVSVTSNSGLECGIDTFYDRTAEARSSLYRTHGWRGYRATSEDIKAFVRARYGRTINSLVLDLRGNPGGFVKEVMACIELFVDRNGWPLLTIQYRKSGEELRATQAAKYHDLRLAVLVDNNSCSASEIFAGVMQDLDRAVIIGEPTIGKALVMRYVDLPNGDKLYLAIGEYLLPSGRCIQRPYSGQYLLGGDARVLPNAENAKHWLDAGITMGSCAEYKTAEGRTVYGSEGIIPDAIISEDFNRDHPAWFFHAVWQATIPFLQRNILWLKQVSADSFSRWPMPDSLLNAGIDSLRAADTSHKACAQLASDVPGLEKWILAYCLWRDQGWFDVRLPQEAAIRRAVSLLHAEK